MSVGNNGALPIQSPRQIDSPDTQRWDLQCDVLTLGLGAAGAATAITAKEQGLDVIVADRFNQGGATARSGGVIYAGGGTPQQRQAGYADTPQAMFTYLQLEVGDAVKPDTLRRFCEDSRGLLAWLESLGARFDSQVAPIKSSYPPDGCFLYFSGNEAIKPYCDAAPPAPRGHRTVDSGLSGQRLFGHLRARVDALGIPVLAQCAARRLLTNPQGRVIGAELWALPADSPVARQHRRLLRRAEWLHNLSPRRAGRIRERALALEQAHARPLLARATRGVVLATGVFVFNREMLAEYAPDFVRAMPLGTSGCEGSGIRLGRSVGGAVARMYKASAWRFINPPHSFAAGLVVNGEGERYCNEASYGARLGVAMCEAQQGQSWLILDRRLARAAFKELLSARMWAFQRLPALLLLLLGRRAKSLAALAQAIGADESRLKDTIAQANEAKTAGQPDSLGKTATAGCEQAPFTALNIGLDSPAFPCPVITLGGLQVNESTSAVLDEAGQDIHGLYAAGRAAVGIASNAYVSGLSLADCLWSGRRAAQALAGETTCSEEQAA